MRGSGLAARRRRLPARLRDPLIRPRPLAGCLADPRQRPSRPSEALRGSGLTACCLHSAVLRLDLFPRVLPRLVRIPEAAPRHCHVDQPLRAPGRHSRVHSLAIRALGGLGSRLGIAVLLVAEQRPQPPGRDRFTAPVTSICGPEFDQCVTAELLSFARARGLARSCRFEQRGFARFE